MAKRLYSLYQKRPLGRKQWVRVTHLEYTKSTAIRVFQTTLLNSVCGGWPELQLRPSKEGETVHEIATS